MPVRPRPTAFIIAMLTATVFRLAALTLPGTEDVRTWKIWAYAASRDVTAVYGIGGDPPTRGVLRWNGLETTVDYPPLALFGLGLAGTLYRQVDRPFRDGALLTAAVKLPGFVCGIALTWLLAATARRLTGSEGAARWAALAYWGNPATFLNAEVLGYLDPLMMLPGVAALVLMHASLPALAGAFLALAALTKPQGILLLPACALAAWQSGRARAVGSAALGGAAAAAAVVLPFARVHALPNMWIAFGSFYARRDILSGNAANVWWIVNYFVRAWSLIPRLGLAGALLTPVRRIMALSTFQEAGFPNPRPFATASAAAACAWALWKGRRTRDLPMVLLVASFTVHAFFVLSVGVHEHHMVLAVPLLALAAALRPPLRPLFYAITAIVTLNMNLFYGFGLGVGWGIPRDLLVLDASIILSALNIAALVWHARTLSRETRTASASAPRHAPAGLSEEHNHHPLRQ